MIENNINSSLVQETWLPGEWVKEVRGYLIIHHNHGVEKGKEKGNKKKKRGREKEEFQ